MTSLQTTEEGLPPTDAEPTSGGEVTLAPDHETGEPRKFAGKYDTLDALESGYAEAQKKLAEQGEEIAKLKTTEAPAESASTAPLEIGTTELGGLDGVIKAAGLEPDAIQAHVTEHGSISDEQLAAIKKVIPGVDRSIADDYIQAKLAEAQNVAAEVSGVRRGAIEMVGSEAKLDSLLVWAKSLGDKRVENLQARLDDPGLYQGALREIMAEHSVAVGADGSAPLIEGGGTPPATDATTFGSTEEQSQAMLDPRYAPVLSNGMANKNHDPAYRASVLKRLR